jgi:catechol 2,3-dioxygenase-like lactoylglutathione lyase family enzyme
LLLRQLRTRSLFIAGAKNNAGVDTSIREACLRDYDVIAVTDCISGVEEECEQTALKVHDRHSARDSNDILQWLEAQGRPRILGFEHMILQVADVEASKHFYLDLLGFTPRRAIPLADGRPVVPFTQGIALTAGNPGRPLQIDHMAFRVTDVRTIAQRLEAAQVRFFNELHDGPLGLTIYVADPDGNKIELFQEAARIAG